MRDWNVVVTVHERHYSLIEKALHALGSTARTDYYNVLAMRVDDIEGFLDALSVWNREHPELQESLARVLPVSQRFSFQSPTEFEDRARAALEPWLAELAGRTFHVRMHRRGFRERMSSQVEEQRLDHYIVECSTAAGAPAQIDFADPDYIVAIETVGQEAGLSLWSRTARDRYPFLHLD